jgi:hypothetical protein
MTTYTNVQPPRRADGLIARLIILILLLVLAILVYDRFHQVLPMPPTPAAFEAPALATVPDGWLDYTELIDAYQADPAVIEARRAYMVEQRMGCETFDRERLAMGVERVTCGREQ